MDDMVKNIRIRNLSAISAFLSFLVIIACGFSLYFASDGTQQVLLSIVILISGWNVVARIGEVADARTALQDLPAKSKLRTVEDRLDDLERLKRRDMVTPEEYAAKRQEILKDL